MPPAAITDLTATADKVALITGAARRIGAALTESLHQQGYRIIIHYGQSAAAAQTLSQRLNQQRANSAVCLQADLNDDSQRQQLAQQAMASFGQLDLLVNNASSFYPTAIGSSTTEQWDDLIGSNAKAPFFLSQALAPALKQSGGNIINIADIHAERPLREHTIYCMAKAANVMLTKSLALELAPQVRVNGIAPGAILWPEQAAELDGEQKNNILKKVPLERPGDPEHIANAVNFLIQPNNYITGQVLSIDGGRSLSN